MAPTAEIFLIKEVDIFARSRHAPGSYLYGSIGRLPRYEHSKRQPEKAVDAHISDRPCREHRIPTHLASALVARSQRKAHITTWVDELSLEVTAAGDDIVTGLLSDVPRGNLV